MNHDLEKFRTLLLTDTDFQKKLLAAAETYAGEWTEESFFNAVLVPIASEYGITATFDEFKEYKSGLENAEMSKDELQQIAGGKLDGGGAGYTSCDGVGFGFGATGSAGGGGACFIIGGGKGTVSCLLIGQSE